MPVPFLPQAAAQYPANADLSKQLMLLGDTIGQGIRGYRRQSLLSDLMTPGADGKVDYDKLAVGLLKMDEPQLAAIMANIGSGQFSRGIQTAQLGISQEQLKLAQAQSAIAQAGEARAAGKERREAGLFSEMFQPRTAQPGLLPAPPPATDPTMQFRPYPGPINAPAASPIAPSVSTMPAAPFAERFSGMPAQPQPGATPPQPQADTISGVPRREMALSMLGYGDAARALREERKTQLEEARRGTLSLNQRIDTERGLRTEYTKLADDFVKVRDAYRRVQASATNPTAAGDLALIFNYMKILDPGSTVRESEFATAQNAGGVDDRIRALWNRVRKGELLSQNMRNDFVERARQLYDAQATSYKKLTEEFSGIAGRLGVDPSNVTPDLGPKDTQGGAVDWQTYFRKK